MQWRDVKPSLANLRAARTRDFFISFMDCGTASSTSSRARSLRTPLGALRESLRTNPPSGSGVSLSMPERERALQLSTATGLQPRLRNIDVDVECSRSVL